MDSHVRANTPAIRRLTGRHFFSLSWLWCAALALLLLAACGGSGGGDRPAAAAPSITTQPASVSVADGQPATFSVVAAGGQPLSYQWLRDGVAVAGATSSTLTIGAAALADTGAAYSVQVSNAAGQSVSATATLTVSAAPPTIVTQPADATVAQGSPATYSVQADGSPTLAFQWSRNGADIAGATDPSYSTPDTTAADDGALFSVRVGNAAGSVTSAQATLTVSSGLVLPAVTTSPLDTSVIAGQPASFAVLAAGSLPLAFQWLRDGADIAGATLPLYMLPSAALSDSGARFTVRVSNAAGSVTSGSALLTVTATAQAPLIVADPQSQTVAAGAVATFSVTHTGSAPFAYQWRRNGVDVSGATSAGYTTPPTTPADDGWTYSVAVTNAAGSVVSAAATLNVTSLWVGIRQDGSTQDDVAQGVATDSTGAVVIVGLTYGQLPGQALPAGADAYVAKYSASGALLWVRTIARGGGTPEGIHGVALDSLDNIYLIGTIGGGAAFAGETSAGSQDAFIAKYDPSGNRLWLRQFGSTEPDYAWSLAVDRSGNAFVAGGSAAALPGGNATLAGDAFVAKFDSGGNRLWVRQFPMAGRWDEAFGVATDDAGNAYITGSVTEDYAGTVKVGSVDAFAAKLDANGDMNWFSRLGTRGWDRGEAIAVNATGTAVYVSGWTAGDFDAPGRPVLAGSTSPRDGFIARIDGSNGAQQWVHNIAAAPRVAGTAAPDDEALGVVLSADGAAAYVTGFTGGLFAGESSNGGFDIYVARYTPDGTRTWARQFGAASRGSTPQDQGRAIALDRNGELFVAGDTIGVLGTPLQNDRVSSDWFVMKLRASDGDPY